MKMVIAYIRHEAFEPIRADLLVKGFPSLSVSEVKGSGRQKGITERYRGAELTNYLRPKVKIECVVADGDVRLVVDTILKHARTGGVGDGKVFVLPVEEAYRVRTGEAGEEILQSHPDASSAVKYATGGRRCGDRRAQRRSRYVSTTRPSTTTSPSCSSASSTLAAVDDRAVRAAIVEDAQRGRRARRRSRGAPRPCGRRGAGRRSSRGRRA